MSIPKIPAAELQIASTPKPQEFLERSTKRARKLTIKRLQNLRYAADVRDWCETFSKTSSEELEAMGQVGREERRKLKERMDQFYRSLCGCSGNSLYRRRNNRREATLITSLTCNNRLCNICNMIRSNKLRRIWTMLFQDEEKNLLVGKAQKHMFANIPLYVCTIPSAKVDKETGEIITGITETSYTSGVDLRQNFNIMHLTLTVRHGPAGWNGKKYYANELIEDFNEMRKAKWWTQMVFGGELCVETTRSPEGGLHIHLHAMILVDKRVLQSRNKLYQHIMARWNHLTIDYTRSESENKIDKTTADGKARWEGIRKSLHFCGDEHFDAIFRKLDGRGSTMIGLKNLYYPITPDQLAKRSPEGTFSENGKSFAYCKSRHPTTMIKGVMECLKYHFEPAVLENEDGTLDMEFLTEILPNIFRKRLYSKFGGFYGVSQLNVTEEPMTVSGMAEDLANTAQEIFDPRTGKPMEDDEYFYGITSPENISYSADKPNYYLDFGKVRKRISSKVGTAGAIQELAEFGYHGEGKHNK